MRRALPLAAVLLAAAPGVARGDGLPIGNVDVGREGVTVPGAPDRIVTLAAGGRGTLVARIERDGGRVQSVLRLRERLTVPAVALDGTVDGRSGDGRTAVLIRPRPQGVFRRRHTRLVVLGLRPLRVRRRVTLRGDFSFDALSPDGRRMYLVEYVDPRDERRYAVRSLDVRTGRLEPGAVVDAREPGEQLRGYPVTRATSADGRWAYTLYAGGDEPFVHALDTGLRRAFCIDVPWLADEPGAMQMGLRLGEGRLTVVDQDRAVAAIDTETMRATDPSARRPSAVRRVPRRAEGGGGPDWWLAGVLAASGFVLVAGGRAVRRSRAVR